MRTKQDILKDIEPLVAGNLSVSPVSVYERLIIELLLDIRGSIKK